MRPTSPRPSLTRTAPALAIARARSGWFNPRAWTAASSANRSAFFGSVSANRSASFCKTLWLAESGFWFSRASASRASVSASLRASANRTSSSYRWPFSADHCMARSGSISAMARMQENAPLLSAFEAYFSQMRIRTCLAKARSSSRPVVVTGFHAGGGSVALSSVIVMPSALPWFLTPVNRYPSLRTKTNRVPGSIPSSRNRPCESVACRDRPGSVAAVEHFRADDRMSVGADDPAGDSGVGVDQHDLADVMGLAELAGQPG